MRSRKRQGNERRCTNDGWNKGVGRGKEGQREGEGSGEDEGRASRGTKSDRQRATHGDGAKGRVEHSGEREGQRMSLNGQVGKQSGEVDKSAAELVKAS